MAMQSFLYLPIIFNFLLKVSFAAETFFTQVKLDEKVFEFEMEYGGTYIENFDGLDDRVEIESINIVSTENENIKCLLRGAAAPGGHLHTLISPIATYDSSPVSVPGGRDHVPQWISYNQLLCYDTSVNPNSAVLILDPNYSGSPSLDALFIVPLDENNEGVAFLPFEDRQIDRGYLLESPQEKLWCKIGVEWEAESVLGYTGTSELKNIFKYGDAVACTTRPRPQTRTTRSERIKMHQYLNSLIEAKRNTN